MYVNDWSDAGPFHKFRVECGVAMSLPSIPDHFDGVEEYHVH